MKDYREVMEFTFKGTLYVMFLDDNNKRFFLKKNPEWSYLELEELIDLVTHLNLTPLPLAQCAQRSGKSKKTKVVPKVLIGGTAIILTLSSLVSSYEARQRRELNEKLKDYKPSVEQTTVIEDYLSYYEEKKHDLKIDTYYDGNDYIKINDMGYLDNVLDYKSVSLNEIFDAIDKNRKISDNYKLFLKKYCMDVNAKYPNADLRVFYENIKTLEVVECEKMDLAMASFSIDSYGCYKKNENKIYVLKDNKYEYGTWEYQVIYHEFSHCLRTAEWNKKGTKIQVQVGGSSFNNTMVEEALNSLFAVSLFNYEEKDIAYQLQSNYHKVMLECLDNYTLSDYVNHSLSYYLSKLDEYNHDDNYASVIMELISMQYKDFHDDKISIEQKQFYPIYDYVAEMYYKKYLSSDMSYERAKELTDELIEKITYDVPEGYNIDTNHFYEFLDEYCESFGISKSGAVRG